MFPFTNWCFSFFFFLLTFCNFRLLISFHYIIIRTVLIFPDGMYMMEVDRVLRPGGYWILSGPPINWRADNHVGKCSREILEEETGKIEEIAELLCWEKSYEMGEISIWRKRTNNKGCTKRKDRATMCNSSYAHNVWYVDT